MLEIFSLLWIIIQTIECRSLNQFTYMKARNELASSNQHYFNMSAKENLVNVYLQKLKKSEFNKSVDNLARPLETNLKQIQASELYHLLRFLPKGGNLHAHEIEMLDRRRFLQIVFDSPEFEYLHICAKSNDQPCLDESANCTCKENYLRYFAKTPPNGWVKVKELNLKIDSIVRKTTLIGMLNSLEEPLSPTDVHARWEYGLKYGAFDIYNELLRFNHTRFQYLRACLDASLSENVQIVEFKRDLHSNLFYFDKKGNEISISDDEEFTMMREFKRQYAQTHPKFIDFVFIVYQIRIDSKEAVQDTLQGALSLHISYPDLISAFDLVGEEDQGHSLLFYIDSLLEGFNQASIKTPSFNFDLHVAETNWPDDSDPFSPEDAVATLSNLYDAVILKSKRIGHGLGLIKHPELYQHFRDNQIAIEVCPSSNKILGISVFLDN
jgi:adenosine deaminase CECR1